MHHDLYTTVPQMIHDIHRILVYRFLCCNINILLFSRWKRWLATVQHQNPRRSHHLQVVTNKKMKMLFVFGLTQVSCWSKFAIRIM
ncbi:hypothetical protein BS17DRAFT_469432 [Gyrodon lividus]|nr:hypothetical protein BS17DRAFT_469432 [Gyrodon lividus]